MVTLSISNIKGGVAKTATAFTLAHGLQRRGKRVLVIDSDPQCNLTMSFMEEKDDGLTLYGIYSGEQPFSKVKKEIKKGLDLLPGDFELCSADMEFLPKVGSLKMLDKQLKKVKDDYDFVIIDTPPNLGVLTLNALMASDCIITPMDADAYSLKAISLLKRTLDSLEEERGRIVPVIGVLLTKYDERTVIARELEDSVQTAAKLLDTKVFKSRIRQGVALKEAICVKQSIFDVAPKSGVAMDYDKFIEEFLLRIKKGAKKWAD